MRQKPSDLDKLNAKNLGQLVRAKRTAEDLSIRVAAEQAKVAFNTLARVEKGHVPDLHTFRRLAEWLGVPSVDLMANENVSPRSTPEIIALHLRSDPSLPAQAAENIAGIVRDLYERLAARTVPVELHLRAARTFRPDAAANLSQLIRDLQAAVEKRWR